MNAKDSETPNKAPTVGKKKTCARRYSVNTRSVSGGAGVGFIFADCFTIKGVRRFITISNVCLFRLK